MPGIIADIFQLGKLVDNYMVDSSTFTSTTVNKIVVPDDRRWFLIGGLVNPDNSSTVLALVKSAADKAICRLSTYSAGTATVQLIDPTDFDHSWPVLMTDGMYVEVTFGVAQGAASEMSVLVVEVPDASFD